MEGHPKLISKTCHFNCRHNKLMSQGLTLYRYHIVVPIVNRGIKHDFPFINIRKVPREVLKTGDEARGFQHFRGTLRMLMNDKIMLIAIIA